MGLFGKKNELAQQVADNEKQKLKQAKTKTKPAGKSMYSGLLQPVLVILLVFSLVGLSQQFLFLTSAEETLSSRNYAFANFSLVKTANQYIVQREKWLKQLADNSSVVESAISGLGAQDIEGISKAAWNDLKAVYLVRAEQLPRLQLEFSQLSFASVDLLRSLAKGETRSLEAFRNGESWFFQYAVPIADAEGNLVGVLLAVFDPSDLESSLVFHSSVTGQVILKASNEAQIPILSKGQSQGGYKQESALSNGWYMSISVSSGQDPLASEQVVFWSILGAAALIAVLAVVLVMRLQLIAIRNDLIRATGVLKAIITGEGKKSGDIRYSEINGMVSSLKSSLKERVSSSHDKSPTEDKHVSASPLPTESGTDTTEQKVEGDAPMFEDDLLDLDILDEAEAQPTENEDTMVTEVNQLDLDVPQSIFRAYDIRGVVDETLNEGVVELIGKAFATEALLQGKSAVCVGYDGRLSSESYCDALTRGIVSTGADAIVVGQVPTPVLYFSTHQLETGTGVMITGSHNPSNYNGFKMMIAGKTLANDDIQKLYNRIILQDFKEGLGARTEQQVSRMYLDTILNDIAVAAPLKVVVDAGNGVAGELGPALVEELGCEVVPLFCDIDGTFPNHHPDPGKPKNLQDLIAAVQEHDADIGLAFDGDGDRVGVVTNTGKIIWPDRLLMLFAKDVVSRNPGADVIFDVKCSRRLNGLISGYGGRPIMWKTGHSLIKAKMKETGALLAGEMSGHIFFKERWLGFDDGLYSAARLLEILGVEDRTSDEVFQDFPEDFSTPEINIEVTDENKFDIVEKLCARASEFDDGNPSTIDGLRVDFQNGWGLCRASNTTPMLVLRFEADNESAIEEIKQKFKDQLAQVDSSLVLDF